MKIVVFTGAEIRRESGIRESKEAKIAQSQLDQQHAGLLHPHGFAMTEKIILKTVTPWARQDF
jgi:hypothetical protein